MLVHPPEASLIECAGVVGFGFQDTLEGIAYPLILPDAPAWHEINAFGRFISSETEKNPVAIIPYYQVDCHDRR